MKYKLIVVLVILTLSSGVFAQKVCISIYNMIPVFMDSSPFTKENNEPYLTYEDKESEDEPEHCLDKVNFKIKINSIGENIFNDWIMSYSFIGLKPKLNILNDAYRKKK